MLIFFNFQDRESIPLFGGVPSRMFCTRRGHGNPVFRKKSRGPRPGTTQRRYEAGGYNDEVGIQTYISR